MTVAIVTPWHGHPELWPDYAEVLAAAHADEVWIVDNGTQPPLEFSTLYLPENLGFSGGSNAGLHAATTDIIVFLNNDVSLLSHDWLEVLEDAVEPGVLAGRLRGDPHADVDGITMPYLDGWCLAGMRDDLLELGGFDETLMEPAYYSDNLLCLEARAAGMTLRQAHVGLFHKSGHTSQPALNPRVQQATLANRERYVARARELLYEARPEAVGETRTGRSH